MSRLDDLSKAMAEAKVLNTFVLNEDAKGFYDTNGFTVLKGSIIAKSSVPSFGGVSEGVRDDRRMKHWYSHYSECAEG